MSAQNDKARGVGDAHRVHAVFKTHLDLGFTDLAANVLRQYLDDFLPKALELARLARKESGISFAWTTGSYIALRALEHYRGKQRKEFERAIDDGDFHWHALPFTTHTELAGRGLMEFGLGISKELDERFGRKTISAKMTDVPGHTIGLVDVLASAGVKFFHIGVNDVSSAPEVPPIFRWRSPAGKEVVVAYRVGGYGGSVRLGKGGDVLLFGHTHDNGGPQSLAGLKGFFESAGRDFPQARIEATSMCEFARRALTPSAVAGLPVVTGELGDTWIHGIGTDPVKVARFLDLSRWRNKVLSEQPELAESAGFKRFSLHLLEVAEHTWGRDWKLPLPLGSKSEDRMRKGYAKTEFKRSRSLGRYAPWEESWSEQRAYLDKAVAEARKLRLKEPLPESDLPAFPEFQYTPHFSSLAGSGWKVEIDPATGGLVRMAKAGVGTWSFPKRPSGVLYQVFSAADYERFGREYFFNLEKHRRWALPDFTKPGMESAAPAERRDYRPALLAVQGNSTALWQGLFVFDGQLVREFGAPPKIAVTWNLEETCVSLTVQWIHKPATRVPEALWFQQACGGSVTMRKLGALVDPAAVVNGGNHWLHGVESVVASRAAVQLEIYPQHSPLYAPFGPGLLRFRKDKAATNAAAFNLCNNIWGTNFPMWCEGEAAFRWEFCLMSQKSSDSRSIIRK